MPFAHANGIELCYDTFGRREGRPLVLIMGLATPMIAWPEEFCRRLADAGHWVVRFDNRDTGLSTKIEELGIPDLGKLMEAAMQGRPVSAPYNLADMAADTLGLMDALGIEKAHLLGTSMGGMIAQAAALNHPWRITSLISVMSSTGERDLPPSTPEAQRAMMGTPPGEREAFIKYMVELGRAFSGGSEFYDAAMQSDLGGRMFDRGLYPWGYIRHMAAIIASGGRRQALGALKIPALVIHGAGDPLLPLEHGRDTAAAIPGSRLKIIEGLGHGLTYPRLWDTLVQEVAGFTAEAATTGA